MMQGGEDILIDAKRLAEVADKITEMFDREVFDYVITSDAAGTVIGSIAAYRLKRGFVAPCSDAPAGRYVLIGYDIRDGKLVDKQIKKVKEKGGTVIKMGFYKEDSSLNLRKTLFRGIPVETVNIL